MRPYAFVCAMSVAGERKASSRVKLTLVCQDQVVLARDILGQVMVHDQPQEMGEGREVDFLVHLGKDRLHEDVALSLASLPDVLKIVDALTPLRERQQTARILDL